MLVQFSVRYRLIMKPTSNVCDLPTSSTNIRISIFKTSCRLTWVAKKRLILPLSVDKVCTKFEEKTTMHFGSLMWDLKPYVKLAKGCLLLPSLVTCRVEQSSTRSVHNSRKKQLYICETCL